MLARERTRCCLSSRPSQRGELAPADALARLGELPFRDLGFARVDTHRELRQGAPEAILAEGKAPEEVEAIARALLDSGAGSVLVTRADAAARDALRRVAPDAEEDERARLAWVARDVPAARGLVTIVSGGTSDGPVVTEARVRAELLGTEVVVHEDAGVAGLHRLAPTLDDLRRADCVVVVAGQDAALASVVGGLVAAPVIGVPTSTGYGAALSGMTALHSMLVSCAAGRRGRQHRRRLRGGHDRGADRALGGRRRVSRVLYLDCVAGVAGDMLLGALLDAGADPEVIRAGLAGLGVEGLELRTEKVSRHAISATHATIHAAPGQPHRDWRSIRTLIDAAGLPERARERAQEAFRRLAHAEGRIHDVDPEQVHFHEVGAVDAIGEVCGVALALESLGVDRVVCSPLPVGRGFVKAAHGRLPLPAPATLALLEGAPLYGVEVETELVTPTGAALVAALAAGYGPLPQAHARDGRLRRRHPRRRRSSPTSSGRSSARRPDPRPGRSR